MVKAAADQVGTTIKRIVGAALRPGEQQTIDDAVSLISGMPGRGGKPCGKSQPQLVSKAQEKPEAQEAEASPEEEGEQDYGTLYEPAQGLALMSVSGLPEFCEQPADNKL